MSIKTFPKLALELLKNNSNILLFADGGYGKTVALVDLYRKILNEKIKINDKKLIPIFVPAAMCEFSVRKYIAMHYYGNNICATEKDMQVLVQNYDEKVFNADNSKYQFVIIIDGINENGKINDLLNEVNVLSLCKNVNVILSSRNIKDLNNYINKGFVQVSLSQVSHEQANAFFSSVDDLPEWAYTPFYLSILKELDVIDLNNLNEYQLINEYVEYSKDKLKNGWNHSSIIETSFVEDLNTIFNNVFPVLCTFLMQSNNRAFSVTESLLTSLKEKFAYTLSYIQLITICDAVLIPMGLLIPVVSHTKKYSIKHEIFMDYFVAKYLMQLCKEEKECGDTECFKIIVEILSNRISKDTLMFFIQSTNEPYDQIQKINDYISNFDDHRKCAMLNQNVVTLFSLLGNEIRDADFSNRNLVSCDFCKFDRIFNSCFDGSVFGNESLPLKNIPDVSSSIFSSVHGKVNISNDICTFVSSDKCFCVDLETGLLHKSFGIDFNNMIGTVAFEYKGCTYLAISGPSLVSIYSLSSLEVKKVSTTIDPVEMHFINKRIYAWGSNDEGELLVYNMENNTSKTLENISEFGGDENRCIWYIDNKNDKYCVRFFNDSTEYDYPLHGLTSQAYSLGLDYHTSKVSNHNFIVINNFLLDGNVIFITNHMVCWGLGASGCLFFTDEEKILDATYINKDKRLIAILVDKTNQANMKLFVFDTIAHSIINNIILDITALKKDAYYQHLLAINNDYIAALCVNGIQVLKVTARKIEKASFIPYEIDDLSNLFSYQDDFILHTEKRIIRIRPSGEIVWEIHNNTKSFFSDAKNFSDNLYFIAQRGDATKVITLDKFQAVSVLNTSLPSRGELVTGNLHFTENPNIFYSSCDDWPYARDDVLGTIVYTKKGNEYKRLFRLSSFYLNVFLSSEQELYAIDDAIIPDFECRDFHVIDESHYVAYGMKKNRHKNNSEVDIEYCIYCISNDQHVNKLFSSRHENSKAVYCPELSKYFICGNNTIDIISVSGEHPPIAVKFDFDMIDEIHSISKNRICFLLFKNSKGWYLVKYDATNHTFLSNCISKDADWTFVEYSSDDIIVFTKWKPEEHTEYTFEVSLKDNCTGILTPSRFISKINYDNGTLRYQCSSNDKIVFRNIDNGNLCIFDKNNINNRYDLFPFLTDVTGSSFEDTNLSQQELNILKQYGATIDN